MIPTPNPPDADSSDPSNAGGSPRPLSESAPSAPGAARLEDAYCPQCGYQLRGLTSACCPECGFDLAVVRDPVSRIPWVHRTRIGRLRAYFQTDWFVTWRRKEFYLEIVRPRFWSS